MKISETFKSECVRRLLENKVKINSAIDLLPESDLWYRPNDSCNSMGNILLHLCGNITQYILCTLGGQTENRQRSLEFSERGPIQKSILLIKLNQIIDESCALISHLLTEDLMKKYNVQCYQETGIGILIHVTEHLSYHTGQLIYYIKMRTGKDMQFYDAQALEQHGNKS